ncbi:DUF5063 domain-containing protein [Shewanella algae]|uniref:DUF5063 domain-containing protein n=1 Tax=Shewanella algae TaxID=38313 RepID=UPI001AAEF2B3|nr:DUF5063 domain-containing protein [Shewanella algae]MBO2638288.1 DUF5063 domain-containing protein [Shewanella algae]
MNIEASIKEFVDFVLVESGEEGDLGLLLGHLDKLPIIVSSAKFTFDEKEYGDAPNNDYKTIRSKVESRFPKIGYYNTVLEISENLESTKIAVGDAVDDLADILGDLVDVLWYFENTSEDDALWHLEQSYISHWGLHLRNLQLYLHDLWW